MRLTSAEARAVLAAAMEDADGRGLAVSVAVLDEGGFLLAFARADGARPYTVDIAISKAYGVIYMGRTSGELRDLAEARPQFFGAVMRLGPRTLIPSPGGVPLRGGAIGVSGAANPDQDVAIAAAAIAATGLAVE